MLRTKGRERGSRQCRERKGDGGKGRVGGRERERKEKEGRKDPELSLSEGTEL
jgi:hypothetical protein